MPKPITLKKREYDRENSRFYQIKLNRKKDADIMDKLASVSSMQGYIKHLIRKDIEENQIIECDDAANDADL